MPSLSPSTARDSRRTGFSCLALACALTLGLSACVAPETEADISPSAAEVSRTFVPSLPVSHPPYREFHASWMQRLDQPYVYFDHYGSYADTAAHIPTLMREMRLQGIDSDGPPFCLFYSDPKRTAPEDLRSRACIPVGPGPSPTTPLRYDVLPSRTIAHVFVSGPYPDVPSSYPHLFAYMQSMNWVADGPIRETYIVPPMQARASRDFLCEVQIPIARRN